MGKRVPRTQFPKLQVTRHKPEPSLSVRNYERILRIVESTVSVMKSNPNALDAMCEEELCVHFLLQLNSKSKSLARSAIFECKRKSNIILRLDGKIVFMAEFRLWAGEKAFNATLDQTLSCESWTCEKTAVLIFNRNRDFGAVLKKITASMMRRSEFKRYTGSNDGAYRYALGSPHHMCHDTVLSVLAFNVSID